MTRAFPDGFLWGAATAAHQVEGDNRHSDWWHFERARLQVHSGAAVRFIDHLESDLDLAQALGTNAFRFSVEWARVEPADGCVDDDALRHYRSVAEAVRAAGMTPMVTLNHFTLPVWLARRGGWMHTEAPSLFGGYCTRVVAAMGDLVDWYCTINEPGAVALAAGLAATFVRRRRPRTVRA